ncbi:hypothetical protein SCP_1502100 [Sparassis crispa]|uniref:Extracellular metalloproteinase n=1 Tax=Sparassis crispa TaxID=139825 RepID=A0A401H458_9APHY|nr:hypothetical protein SCP_1502100 [Sparassis crispa]GBE89202.1 hypothetical protein SCP_1502100 [Sparassis crispa]
MGSWAANRENGIRNFAYSLNNIINPSTYQTLDKPATDLEVRLHRHALPSCTLENGTVPEGDFYRPTEFTATGDRKPLVLKHGNSLIVQLVLNGMKIQACRPSFLDARDAILDADEVLTGGENYCDLYAGFVSRGLGPNARVDGRRALPVGRRCAHQ